MWCRVEADIRDHPKYKKLGRLLNKERAHSYVVDLWGWAVRFHPTGNLTECDCLDVAAGCGWEGDAVAFVDALVDARVLDREEDMLLIHDWPEHQGKVVARAEAAKVRSAEWRKQQKVADAGVSGKDAKALADHWFEEWTRIIGKGTKPVVGNFAITMQAAKRILAARPLEDAKRLVTAYLKKPPDWYADKGLFELQHIAQAANRIIVTAEVAQAPAVDDPRERRARAKGK